MSDLLRPLLNAIETVRDRIERASGWSEAQTRASLIDPILTALGWDVADPALVRHEFTSQGGRADYALLAGKEELAAIVEAKPLNTPLGTKEIGQTTNYANMLGAPYAALTNGDRWVLYDVFKPAKIEDRLLVDVTVSRAEVQTTALSLLALWRPNATSKQWRQAEEPRVTNSQAPPPPPPPPDDDWIAFEGIRPTGKPPPAVLRFEDGSEHTPTTWRDVFGAAIAWLYRRNELTEAAMPVLNRTGTKPVIHLKTKASLLHHPKDVAGTPLAFSGHMSAGQLVGATKRLLKRYGHSPASVRVKLHN